MSSIDWDDLRFFLAVSREKSVRAAASVLRVNHTTVSRRIAGLERSLGVRLFDRKPSGYERTPAGEDLLASASQVEEGVHGIERRVLGQDARLTGEIRVTLPDLMIARLLMPKIREFTDAYPGIELELITSYDLFNLTKREADIAVRFTNSPPEHLIGKRLVTAYKSIYGSAEYLARCDPRDPASGAFWLGWDDPVSFPDWITASPFPGIPARHRFNHPALQVEALKAGIGIGMIPCLLGDVEPDLRRLPPGMAEPVAEIWLLTHPDLRYTVRIRTFLDFVTDAVRSQRDLIEGRCPIEA